MIPKKDWRDHELFIKAAAEAKKNSPFKNKFSEGVVKHVETLLHTKLPRPAYFDRLSDSPPELVDTAGVPESGRTVQMAIEDHPLYPEWRAALERVIATKGARDAHRIGSKEFHEADAQYQAALTAYDAVARMV
jgi:hypothetical protein